MTSSTTKPRKQRLSTPVRPPAAKHQSSNTIFSKLAKLFKDHPKLVGSLVSLSPIIIYLALSLLYFGPPAFAAIRHSMFNAGPDSQLIMWSLNWWPFSLVHHLNPFYTRYIWAPQGFNLTWATSVPTLALLLAPISWLFGALASYNVLAVTGLALSALSCFYLVRYLTKNYWSALLAGYIFGFSSYQLGQYVGHPSLYITALIPLLILVYLLRLHGKIKRATFIGLACVLDVLQFGISNEVFASFMAFSFISLLLFYLLSNQAQRKILLKTTIEFYLATILACIILAPYFYYFLKGLKTAPVVINSPEGFSTDILNFIIPTPITKLGSGQFIGTALRFTGNFSEDGAYLGIPLLLVLAYYSIRNWRKYYVKALVTSLVLLMIFTLGPVLQIYGKSTHIPLPWYIAAHLPLIKSALPDRFTMFISLLAAIMVGLWLSLKSNFRTTVFKYLVVIVCIIFLIPNVAQYHWQNVSAPLVFQPKTISKYIKKDSNIVVLPYGILGSSMYDQYVSNMWFTQAGGYIGFTPNGFSGNPVVETFLGASVSPNFTSELYSFCIANRVSQIIYTPLTSLQLIKAVNETGWAEQRVGNSILVSVPK